MNNYYERTLNDIYKAFDSLNEDCYSLLLKHCEEVIKNNGHIIVSGLGKNVPICEKFVGTMTSLSLPACFLHTNTAMHGDLGYVTDKDLLIILTKSGNTDESVALAKYVKETRKTKIWLITMGEDTAAEKYADNVLRIKLNHEGDKWNLVPINSSTIFLMLLQGMALELADRFGITLSDFKKNHPGGAIGRSKNE